MVIQLVITDLRHTQNAQISQRQDGHNIYAVKKTMCPPGYHHSGFVATHALGHIMYDNRTSCAQVHELPHCHKATVVITRIAHCFHDCI